MKKCRLCGKKQEFTICDECLTHADCCGLEKL